MATEPPEDGPEFDAMMREIDRAMADQDIAITARPMMAGIELWKRYKIAFPYNDPGPHGDPELRRYWPLSQKVSAWFDATYGDLLKVNYSPGATAIRIDGDIYRMNMPLFFGTGECIISKRFFETKNFISRGFLSNILQLLENLTEPKAQMLSNKAIRSIVEWFPVALRVMYVLEATSERHELVAEARSDLKTAVDKLMERRDHYGSSKWASLQAAEKCFKAAIELQGGKYDRTHKLKELSADLTALGVQLSTPQLFDDIQCEPGIRYREDPCSREQALAAHRACLYLVLDLVAAGAKFSDHLIIRQLSPVLFQTINTTPSRLSKRTRKP
jgi:hypothetical protein